MRGRYRLGPLRALAHLNRLAPALLAAALLGGSMTAQAAADERSVQRVFDAVKAQYPDIAIFCALPENERRSVVVKATVRLATERQLAEPMVAGPEAGNRLRAACGKAAQDNSDPALIRWATTAKPLAFASERLVVSGSPSLQALKNRVLTPAGDGPFPAVVLGHTMGGVSGHLLTAAQALLGAGYAVMVVDSFGPRGLQGGALLPPADYAKDAYDALAHLQAQPFIQKDRIFQAGYSAGALAAVLLADPASVQELGAKGRFRASVSHYGGCVLPEGHAGVSVKLLSPATDRPLLLLMAGQDIETPTRHCFPQLEQMQAAGKPVQWHIYPDAVHAWDKPEHAGHVYRDPSGASMTYRYDAAVSRDATERMLAFFASLR